VINLCRNRYHFLLGFGAALQVRCASILPPNRQPGTLRAIAAAYPGSVCLHDDRGANAFANLGIECIRVDTQQGVEGISGEPPLIAPRQLAVIASTSGSTGQPVSHDKFWFTLCATARLLARRLVTAGERPAIVATVPSQHMYGLEMTIMMVLQGGCVMSDSHPFYAHDITAVLHGLPHPRMLVTTPIHLRHMLRSLSPMPVVERVVSATAPLDQSLARAAEMQFGGRLDEIFGFTEAGSIATRQSSVEQSWSLLDGMKVRPEKNATYVTGLHLPRPEVLHDIVAAIDEQRFDYLGRAADMINVGGKRASLVELTARLLDIDGVDDGVVFMPGEGAQRPAALVVSELGERQIIASLARSVDPVLLPRPVKKVTRIPRNPTGKVTRESLHQMLGADGE
jgi:acyl-coenzyme A synthetase/AMP-(fatty) acid ligase